MTDLGKVESFLGIKVRRDRERQVLTLTQTDYMDKILAKFGFETSKPVKTPMVTGHVLNHQHQINPTDKDWNMVKRVFRYLAGTKSLGLRFLGRQDNLEAFSDASFGDCKGSLTTSGYVIKLFGDSVAWRTHKQTYVALSTYQAEYVAPSEACRELMAVDNSLKIILSKTCFPADLWCDNKAVKLNFKISGSGKLRHMTEIHEHHIRECVTYGRVTVRFDIIKKLGQGTYGKVQLGINKETGQEVAIKTIKKCKIETEADLIRIRREIQIMSSVEHPNIIHIYEVFENKEKMVLVMEYAAGGELYDYLSEHKILPEDEARRIFRQICTAVYYCHKHKICHRDLKLENVLLDQMGNAKIADFGLSNVFDSQILLHTFCGSPLYASPEIVKGTPYNGPEVDCWSLGVLLYTLVYGAMPFDGSNFKRLVKQICESDYFEPKKISSASTLIREMLTVCPVQRANIKKICSHWWINKGYEQSCSEFAEELAKKMPGRLDLLLSLVTKSTNAEKFEVGSHQTSSNSPSVTKLTEDLSFKTLLPMRCHSVGNVIELDTSLVGKKKKGEFIDVPSTYDSTILTSEKRGLVNEGESTAHQNLIEKLSLTNDMDKKENHQDVVEKQSSRKCKDSCHEDNYNTKNSNNHNNNRGGSNNNNPTQLRVPEENSLFQCRNSLSYIQTKKNRSNTVNTPIKEAKKLKASALSLESDMSPSKSRTKSLSERRKSKIFETTEKFKQISSPVEQEKPKIFIPGVNVGGAKLVFEKKASISPTTLPQTFKVPVSRVIIDVPATDKNNQNKKTFEKDYGGGDKCINHDEEKKKALDIITGALCKPPVQKKLKGCISIVSIDSKKQLPEDTLMPRKSDDKLSTVLTSISFQAHSDIHSNLGNENVKQTPDVLCNQGSASNDETKCSKVEIILKSATLPRLRKTSKAKITLLDRSPIETIASSEILRRVEINRPRQLKCQSLGNSFLVSPTSYKTYRSCSLDSRSPIIPDYLKERIIPIQIEQSLQSNARSKVLPSRMISQQRSLSQRMDSFFRRSTADAASNTLSSVSDCQPIYKVQEEYIIPISVEEGGYLTHEFGSVQQSYVNRTITDKRPIKSKFYNVQRLGPLLSDASDDDLPLPLIHRDNEDLVPRNMHQLRSTRLSRQSLDHADSLTSDEDDDDDGFELLTAENLFSTLLSRVRSLTQRLNVDDKKICNFPSKRLLTRFDANLSSEF
ncbi:uncharacterized protein LOC106640733 [Copidosoma floridanum]|uniref:uncharacterized protein LOC106640733 n=1 Tax=Copidosoma floridanum TaxID=29053 RepID=UPI0006C96E3A|nr:uncharacterized protein LOC106640733 [Copidosoma floridanum]